MGWISEITHDLYDLSTAFFISAVQENPFVINLRNLQLFMFIDNPNRLSYLYDLDQQSLGKAPKEPVHRDPRAQETFHQRQAQNETVCASHSDQEIPYDLGTGHLPRVPNIASHHSCTLKLNKSCPANPCTTDEKKKVESIVDTC